MGTNTYEEFGNRLRAARKASGLTVAKASAHFDISSDQLYRYERGEFKPGNERAALFIEFIREQLGDQEAGTAAVALATGRNDGPSPAMGEDPETLEWVRRLRNLSDSHKDLLRVFLEGLEGRG